MRKSIRAAFVSIILLSSPALADMESAQLLSELSEGMSYRDVLDAWGPPVEKVEKEARRMDVWVYDDSRVEFSNGKLTRIESTSGEKVALKGEEQSQRESGNAEVPVSDILNEIMDSTR